MDEWIYYAIAKNLLGGGYFICEFPREKRGYEGDRVTAVDKDGSMIMGDIIYSGLDRPNDKLLNAVIRVLGGEMLKAVNYWTLHIIEDLPKDEEEGTEDGASAEDDSTVSC